MMQLLFLKILHFRNYENLSIELHPRLNIFYGKNGSGKTNLVEAIYVLALTRSFRGVSDKVLIRSGVSLSKIEGDVKTGDFVNNFRIYLTKDGKKVQVNKNRVTKLSDYITKIPLVLFHPDDLKIIKDTPSTRRKLLNISISQYCLSYLKNLSNYNKILKQRNSYLKQLMINANKDYNYLNILNDKLINLGLKIYEERKNFVLKMNDMLAVYYQNITQLGPLCLEYKSSFAGKNKNDLLAMYKESLKKDLAFGKTNLGIHTDDLVFELSGHDLKEFGSEGQQKNAVIAYKLCELTFLKEMLGFYPILILDDLFSELDSEKIENIFKMLKKDVQTFITTTNLEFFKSLNLDYGKQFEIASGKIVREEFLDERK